MSEQIREQVSAFLDGELPNTETELLLKRLTRDAELRESFGRYALIGESLRGGAAMRLSVESVRGFTTRVNRAIDGEPGTTAAPATRARDTRWWRPLAGAAVAAGVAVVAVLALQQRAETPTMQPGVALTARNAMPQDVAALRPKEALSYTVPAAVADGPGVATPSALPAARLTNYVFAHSKYSSVLGQENVLSGLLSTADESEPAVRAAADAAANATRTGHDGGEDATSQPRDTRVAP